jgi:RimJ/RimL family protein N-acetyltransferase
MWEDNAPSAAVARRLGAQDLGVRHDPWYGGQSRMFLLRPEHLDG